MLLRKTKTYGSSIGHQVLTKTINQTNILMHDLKTKSEALTNTLVPRSPITPKKLSPLPGHSTYSMKSRD